MPGLDAKLAAAFRDVPVPQDLAAHLLAGLQAAQCKQSSTVGIVEVDPEQAIAQQSTVERVADDVQPADYSLSRRGLLWYASAIAAALMIGVGVWSYWPRSDRPVDLDSLIGDWYATIDESGWKNPPCPEGYVVPTSISANAQRWQNVAASIGRGVVFDLTRPNSAPATLFVANRTLAGIPTVGPPMQPQSDTGGRVGAAWQTGGLLYVLVIDGSDQDYRDYVRTQDLAWQPLHQQPQRQQTQRQQTIPLPALPDRYGRLAVARFVKSS